MVVTIAAGCAVSGGTGQVAPGTLPSLVEVPSGIFIRGSSRSEREDAYRLDEAAYGHDVTRRRRWYENEFDRGEQAAANFAITLTPVTNRQYAAFVAATGHPPPDVDPLTWQAYGLAHSYDSTRRFAWPGRDGSPSPPGGREDHPVVLVSHGDAEAYAAWLSVATARTWRLPTENEWEKATRGPLGARFPWGDEYDPRRLNSHDLGPYDTLPVGQLPDGASPFGLLDGAGQVYEWTATAAPENRFIVKGGSWDDKGCGVCRPAARHSRPADLRHIIIGFRLVREPVSVGLRQ